MADRDLTPTSLLKVGEIGKVFAPKLDTLHGLNFLPSPMTLRRVVASIVRIETISNENIEILSSTSFGKVRAINLLLVAMLVELLSPLLVYRRK